MEKKPLNTFRAAKDLLLLRGEISQVMQALAEVLNHPFATQAPGLPFTELHLNRIVLVLCICLGCVVIARDI